MSDILVPNLAAYDNRTQLKVALPWPKEKLTESARSRKAGGLCLRPSEDERLSIVELGLFEMVFMVTKSVGNFACRV
jgi:hypothetical protein